VRERLIPEFESLASPSQHDQKSHAAKMEKLKQFEKTYGEGEQRRKCGVRPDLCVVYHHLSAEYARRGQEDQSYFQQSIKAGMDALEAVGVVIWDRSIFGPIKKKNKLPVDTTRGPSHMRDLCTGTVLHFVVVFLILGEEKRARKWLKVAHWLDDIYMGGGAAMFKLRYKMVLEQMGLTHLVQ